MTITLPLPPNDLHPNGRPTWQKRMRLTKKARGEAALLARQHAPPKPYKTAVIQPTFYLPRARDRDGLGAWLKAYLDGLQGIIYENDSGVTLLPAVMHTGKALDHRVELVIEGE